MVKDDELIDLWDRAISNLSQGRHDIFKESFRQVMERSEKDLEGCGEVGKLRMVGRQLDNWWETFWA